MSEIPWSVVGPILAVVVAVDVALLVDLARRQVKVMPKWAWALIIVLVSFPIGPILYLAIGRVPKGSEPLAAMPPPTARPPDAAQRRPEVRIELPAHREATPTPAAESVVVTRGLRKVYGEVAAVDGVDLAVPRGSTYGLIGPNGAGKTTLLSLLNGLRRPTAGAIEIAVPRARVTMLPDTPQYEPWLTAREVVALAHHLQSPATPEHRIDEVLELTGIAEAADRRVGGFSRGMLQRLGLASCLVSDPELLFLDEPSSALDPAGRREVLDLIGQLAGDATVVLSTHILSDVQQVCDTVGVIDRGVLRYQGPLADLLARTSSAVIVHVRPPAQPVVQALRAAAVVEDVIERAPGQLLVTVRDAAEAELELPRLLSEAGARLIALNPSADLETAFLELTR